MTRFLPLLLLLLPACTGRVQPPLPYGPDDTARRQPAPAPPAPADPPRKAAGPTSIPLRKGAVVTGRAVRIVDGDTFDLLADGAEPLRIRLHGVDAPEKAQDFGQVAKEGLGELLERGTAVRVTVTDRDRYGRAVCDVWTERAGQPDLWVNEALVRRGWAWHYAAYSKDARLAAAEQAARQEGAGLWAQPKPTPPWAWRRAKRGAPKKSRRKAGA